jgi:nucleotide-binding universal stress UspA family protein
LVQDAIEQLHHQDIDATGSVAHSASHTVGQVIAEEARARRCDVIVLGSRRRGLGALGRRTRERITRHSTLPILTAPSPLRIPARRLGRRSLVAAGGLPPTAGDR